MQKPVSETLLIPKRISIPDRERGSHYHIEVIKVHHTGFCRAMVPRDHLGFSTDSDTYNKASSFETTAEKYGLISTLFLN